ncbi:MAG: hypothetical protein WA970_13660, partial [Gammaproteobacteria bacterium]
VGAGVKGERGLEERDGDLAGHRHCQRQSGPAGLDRSRPCHRCRCRGRQANALQEGGMACILSAIPIVLL